MPLSVTRYQRNHHAQSQLLDVSEVLPRRTLSTAQLVGPDFPIWATAAAIWRQPSAAETAGSAATDSVGCVRAPLHVRLEENARLGPVSKLVEGVFGRTSRLTQKDDTVAVSEGRRRRGGADRVELSHPAGYAHEVHLQRELLQGLTGRRRGEVGD